MIWFIYRKKTDWQNEEIFTHQHHQRLINNLDKLKAAYYIYSSTPITPTYMYGYQEANSIEKILVDIEAMITIWNSFVRNNVGR